MKFTIGGRQGVPFPRLFNPPLFLFIGVCMIFGTLVMAFFTVLLLVLSPFAWLIPVRRTG